MSVTPKPSTSASAPAAVNAKPSNVKSSKKVKHVEWYIAVTLLITSMVILTGPMLIVISVMSHGEEEHTVYKTPDTMHVVLAKSGDFVDYSYRDIYITGKFKFSCNNHPTLSVDGKTTQVVDGTLKTRCTNITVMSMNSETVIDIKIMYPSTMMIICRYTGWVLLVSCMAVVVCVFACFCVWAYFN